MKRTPAQKTKAPTVAAVGALRIGQSSAKYSDRSTATEAQRERILQALRRRPQTTCDLRKMGIFQAPARVMELRLRGYLIETTRIALVDQDGYLHKGAARYALISEPKGIQGTLPLRLTKKAASGRSDNARGCK